MRGGRGKAVTRGACLLLAAFQTRSSSYTLYILAWGGGHGVRGGDRGRREKLERCGNGQGVKREDGGNLSVTRRANGNERQATSMCYIKSPLMYPTHCEPTMRRPMHIQCVPKVLWIPVSSLVDDGRFLGEKLDGWELMSELGFTWNLYSSVKVWRPNRIMSDY